jgi:hypothetical protein
MTASSLAQFQCDICRQIHLFPWLLHPKLLRYKPLNV